MNLFNLNNEQILQILTGQNSNPNKILIYILIAILVILCVLFLILFPIQSDQEMIEATYEHLTESDIENLKEKKRLNRMALTIVIVFFLTIGLIVNNVIFIKKHKGIHNEWMTNQIQQIAKTNPLLFAKSNNTKKLFDISDFTYDDNKLTATVQLKTPKEYESTYGPTFLGFSNGIVSSINGSINITADINTHTMEIDPNDVNTAIMFKIQTTLKDNNIEINPDTVDFNKDKNQIKALGDDSNEIITINFSDNIDDLNINIESTKSEPITIKIE